MTNKNVRIIKKYSNRRLYDTEQSAYITLNDVKQLVLEHVDFAVQEAKTNEDITRSVLLQILLELESGGVPLFNLTTLQHFIRFYGQPTQGMMGDYIEQSMQAFIDVQNKMAEQTQSLYNTQFNQELWKQLMEAQKPMFNTLMSNYMEQSKDIFTQMQEQMQNQTQQFFKNFNKK